MKYTPEEMYDYCQENELSDKLDVALQICGDKFLFMPAIGHFEEEDDGLVFVLESMSADDEDTTTEYMRLPEDENCVERRNNAIKEGCTFVSSAMYMTAEDEEEGSFVLFHTFAENQDEADEEVYKQIEIKFLEYMGINTKGRLKALFDKVEEHHKSWAKGQVYIDSLKGESETDKYWVKGKRICSRPTTK